MRTLNEKPAGSSINSMIIRNSLGLTVSRCLSVVFSKSFVKIDLLSRPVTFV